MDKLKKLLALECSYAISDELMDRFLAPMQIIKLKRGDILIDAGEVNPDFYIVKEGVFAYNYFNGASERCEAFATPGTMMYSCHSYYYGKPTFYSIEACCASEVLHCPKRWFDSLVASSHEFAIWALSMTQCQVYFSEMKKQVINGDAAERFCSLLRNRPEILEKVPMKTVAAYLGITQQYLSYLKKIYLKKRSVLK